MQSQRSHFNDIQENAIAINIAIEKVPAKAGNMCISIT